MNNARVYDYNHVLFLAWRMKRTISTMPRFVTIWMLGKFLAVTVHDPPTTYTLPSNANPSRFFLSDWKYRANFTNEQRAARRSQRSIVRNRNYSRGMTKFDRNSNRLPLATSPSTVTLWSSRSRGSELNLCIVARTRRVNRL